MWPRRCPVYRWRELVAAADVFGRERENRKQRTLPGHRGGPARNEGAGQFKVVWSFNPLGEERQIPRQKNAGLWEPYDGRHPREGEVPSRHRHAPSG